MLTYRKVETLRQEMPDFAVIKTGGKQYKVVLGQLLNVEKLEGKDGEVLEFDDLIAKNKVSAKIIGNLKAPKVKILKFKNKTGYKRNRGHRQQLTKIRIEQIGENKISAEKTEHKERVSDKIKTKVQAKPRKKIIKVQK